MLEQPSPGRLTGQSLGRRNIALVQSTELDLSFLDLSLHFPFYRAGWRPASAVGRDSIHRRAKAVRQRPNTLARD